MICPVCERDVPVVDGLLAEHPVSERANEMFAWEPMGLASMLPEKRREVERLRMASAPWLCAGSWRSAPVC